ncbi:MAG: hypothetical protein WCB27_16340, partial [Thermoguttaceae bacterium]
MNVLDCHETSRLRECGCHAHACVGMKDAERFMLKKIQPTPAPTCPRKRGHGTRLMSRKDSATHAENRTRTVSRGGAQPV